MNTYLKKIELLAPAKDKQTAFLAIDAGADAVYIGYQKFGARKLAGNSIEDIKEVVEYADKFRVKIYVTLNTIYSDDEIQDVVKIIFKLYEIGVSAIIIQDMGLLEFELPPIRIFASTQCHNNTLDKIKFLEKTGFQRVILPREFSLKEIKNISDNTCLEIETFVHGALCVSYSGQCYLSHFIGGRSANRGECAQPCRKKYSLVDSDGKIIAKDKYLLSLKDLNLSNRIEELIDAGVTSFKIEGRLKDEIYVVNVVSYYRQIIDKVIEKKGLERLSCGRTYLNYEPDLEKSFNRGYTEFFIDGVRKNFCSLNYNKAIGKKIGKVKFVGKNYFILDNSDEKLIPGDGICFFSDKKELFGTNIQKIENDKIFPKNIEAIYVGEEIFRNYDKNFAETVVKKNIERKIPLKAIFIMSEQKMVLKFIDEEENESSSELNGFFERAENTDLIKTTIKKQISKTGNTEFEIIDVEIQGDETYFLQSSFINELRRTAIEALSVKRKQMIDRNLRDEKIQISEYPENIIDYSSNVYNQYAKSFYEKRNAKVVEYAAETKGIFKEKVLMTTKHCLKYALGLCSKISTSIKKYKEPFFLVDEYKQKYKLSFDCKDCKMQIFSYVNKKR